MTPNGAEEPLFARDDIERSLVARLALMVEVHGHRIALRDEKGEVVTWLEPVSDEDYASAK